MFCGFPSGSVAGAHGSLLIAAGTHQVGDELLARVLGQVRVGGAPQAATDNDVAAVRSVEGFGWGCLGCGHGNWMR